jgi:hypothetical protein
MRNRRRDENFEERKRRRAENSEILRQIAEKFETREDSASVNKINNDVNISNIAKDQEQSKIENGFDIIAKMMENRMNEKNSVDIVKDNNNEEKVSNNNSIYGRKFEVSDEQKKALEDFFSFNSKKVEYGEDTNISKKERNRFRKSRPNKRIYQKRKRIII